MGLIDELKKIKDLLDTGVITQEEFVSLKKQVIEFEVNNQGPVKTPLVSNNTHEAQKNVSVPKPMASLKNIKQDAVALCKMMNINVSQKNLIYYAEIGDVGKVRLLINAGLNPNDARFNEEEGEPIYPLHNTARRGTSKMVKLLIDNGADVNLKDNKGNTALFYAVENGKDVITKTLIANGANASQVIRRKRKTQLFAKRGITPMLAPLAKIALFAIILIFVAICSLFNVDIHDEEAVIKRMQGTWVGYAKEAGIYTHFKLEISGTRFKGWMQPSYSSKAPNWGHGPDEIGTFTLSPVQQYTNSNSEYRNINFYKRGGGYGNNSLMARALTNSIIYDEGLYVVGWGRMNKK